jgi:hypothetical protein
VNDQGNVKHAATVEAIRTPRFTHASVEGVLTCIEQKEDIFQGNRPNNWPA